MLDNGGHYWFAAHNNSTDGVRWAPGGRFVSGSGDTYAYGFRPIIRLSSSVYMTGGSGTMDDPYTIDVGGSGHGSGSGNDTGSSEGKINSGGGNG